MRLIVVNRKRALITLLSLSIMIVAVILFVRSYHRPDQVGMVMGGRLYQQILYYDDNKTIEKMDDVETYFRPSDLPVLNDRFNWSYLRDDMFKKVSEINLPDTLLNSPEETLMNYFSILREAANHKDGTITGCGTVGNSTVPYPVAYNFLSSSYQDKLSYEAYLDTFKNILHINLIKYKKVPVYDSPSDITRYFVEIETIEGSEKGVGYFAYYYGFVDIVKEGNLYKISNLEFHGENYLCAPYHGWSHDAELSVKVRYGGWCSLIETFYPIIKNEYVKHVYFKGTDGNDYMIEFYHLTNDTDIEIAQYKKGKAGDWKLIKLDPKKCLKNNN